MHKQQENPRTTEEEKDMFRRMVFQIMLAFCVVHSLHLYMLEKNKCRYSDDCECAQCLEKRNLEDAEHARLVYKTVH